MRLSLFTLPLAALLLAACVPASQPDTANDAPLLDMANPASVYCEEQGGSVSYEDSIGMCHLPDGSVVEEWEFYRANH